MMTNFDLIKDAISAIKNDLGGQYAIELLETFVRANTMPKKSGKLNIWNWVSKDKWRDNLWGVFHDTDKQVAVATDTHVLVVSAADYREPDENAIMCNNNKVCGCQHLGYTICKDGRYLTKPFPAYEHVIPEQGLTRIHVDRERVRELVRQDDAARKAGTRRTLAIRITTEASKAFISPQYCKLLLTLPEGQFWVRGGDTLTKFVSDDGQTIALFMHICQSDEQIYQDVILAEEKN
jgi:hypothetical protein